LIFLTSVAHRKCIKQPSYPSAALLLFLFAPLLTSIREQSLLVLLCSSLHNNNNNYRYFSPGCFSGLDLCRFVKELLLMSQNNYPYLTDHTFFVNTPWMFSVVWAVLKTVLSKHTLSKSHILTTSYHDILMEYIDASNLPPDFRPEGTAAVGGTSNHSSALSDTSEGAIPNEKVQDMTTASDASVANSSRTGTAIQSNSSSSSGSSSSVSLSSNGSQGVATGRVTSPGKKSAGLFGLNRSREASREVKVIK